MIWDHYSHHSRVGCFIDFAKQHRTKFGVYHNAVSGAGHRHSVTHSHNPDRACRGLCRGLAAYPLGECCLMVWQSGVVASRKVTGMAEVGQVFWRGMLVAGEIFFISIKISFLHFRSGMMRVWAIFCVTSTSVNPKGLLYRARSFAPVQRGCSTPTFWSGSISHPFALASWIRPPLSSVGLLCICASGRESWVWAAAVSWGMPESFSLFHSWVTYRGLV